jgi:hypothetical protein
LIAESDLADLHAAVEHALEQGEEGELNVIGWGEISLGVGWPPQHPEYVAKRMPPFADRAAFESYVGALEDYVRVLGDGGVSVVETEVLPMPVAGGAVVAYAVQPILPAETLGPVVLRGADPAGGHPLVDAIVDATLELVGPRVGLDPQLSNWSWTESRGAILFDVTTPFLRDEAGRDRMDFGVLVASFPRIARGPLMRFVAPSIIAQYHDPRTVITDACGNLIKERLEAWIPRFLERANRGLDDPVGEQDVRAYYRSDARTWRWIQRIRHADRAWHRLRGRTYPFLIPGEIER